MAEHPEQVLPQQRLAARGEVEEVKLDRARTVASIRDALTAGTEHWTGEYRFRRADGSWADLLERAVIVRDRKKSAL